MRHSRFGDAEALRPGRSRWRRHGGGGRFEMTSVSLNRKDFSVFYVDIAWADHSQVKGHWGYLCFPQNLQRFHERVY
jgi:hypothetical protein